MNRQLSHGSYTIVIIIIANFGILIFKRHIWEWKLQIETYSSLVNWNILMWNMHDNPFDVCMTRQIYDSVICLITVYP